ncbi:MAG: hypothetical protein ACREE2_08885 [Stellaceae bacterium]
MIRVPDWIGDRLGDYYLYFADHKGSYIRLAYADHPEEPWRVHKPGSLLTGPPGRLAGTGLALRRASARARHDLRAGDALLEITTPHIAFPDVHVDHSGRRIIMYFHGLADVATQVSRVVISMTASISRRSRRSSALAAARAGGGKPGLGVLADQERSNSASAANR